MVKFCPKGQSLADSIKKPDRAETEVRIALNKRDRQAAARRLEVHMRQCKLCSK